MRDTSAGPVVWVVSAGDVPEITTDGTLLSVDGSTVEVTIGDDGRMGLQLSR